MNSGQIATPQWGFEALINFVLALKVSSSTDVVKANFWDTYVFNEGLDYLVLRSGSGGCIEPCHRTRPLLVSNAGCETVTRCVPVEHMASLIVF